MYKESKKTLEELRAEIIEQSTNSDNQGIRGSGTSNSTERKAISLLTTPAIVNLERNINAIENTLKSLSNVHQKVFEEYYVNRNKNKCIIAMKLNISEATLYRHRKALIVAVGHKLGWINIS